MGRGFFNFSRVGIYVIVVVPGGLLSGLKSGSAIVPKIEKCNRFCLYLQARAFSERTPLRNSPFSHCSFRRLFSQGQNQTESCNTHGYANSDNDGRSDTSTPGIILVLSCKRSNYCSMYIYFQLRV